MNKTDTDGGNDRFPLTFPFRLGGESKEATKEEAAVSLSLTEKTPPTFKVGRAAAIQLAKVERNLFTDIEERASGNYIVSGLPRNITETDFYAFGLAVSQLLYNQSVQSGNTETNTGLKKKRAVKASKTGETRYSGCVQVTLNNLCRLAYGVTDDVGAIRKRGMESLIETLNTNDVTITFLNGDTLKAPLCSRMVYKEKATGAKAYILTLNPIFCEDVKRNFSLFPQDITLRLSAATERKTKAHYKLLNLLGMQDKRKPFIRTIGTLFEELGLDTKRASRSEVQLISVCEDMVKIGIITGYETEKGRLGRRQNAVKKVTFYLNKDFPNTKTEQ